MSDVTNNDGRNGKNTAYSFSHLKTAAGIKIVQSNAPMLKFPKGSYSALVSAFFSPEVQFCAHTQRNFELVDQHFRDQAPLCVLTTDLS